MSMKLGAAVGRYLVIVPMTVTLAGCLPGDPVGDIACQQAIESRLGRDADFSHFSIEDSIGRGVGSTFRLTGTADGRAVYCQMAADAEAAAYVTATYVAELDD
jgi:hypothetical protein